MCYPTDSIIRGEKDMNNLCMIIKEMVEPYFVSYWYAEWSDNS